MMNERQLISEIGGIARRAVSVAEAVSGIESLLRRAIGSATLLLRQVDGGRLNETAVSDFLESREFPFRGVYTAPLVEEGNSRATLVACFGSWGAPGELLRRATVSIARDLSTLSGRLRLPAVTS
jgi:hypothetical protein